MTARPGKWDPCWLCRTLMRGDVSAGSYAGAIDVVATTDAGQRIKATVHHYCLDIHRAVWRRGMSELEVVSIGATP